ncbi:unnamed protein product [marine sediment metagenome]|uniref:Uncharacterized protein n=1 Tax=marine sediment metagenome TaxID=412755 RepID=X1SR82_9ZZZZ
MSDDSFLNVMVGAIFAVAGVMVLVPTLQRIFPVTQLTQYLEAQAYVGLIDDRTLNATPTMQWLNLISNPPYHPWITAYFFNDGPHSVFIAINNPNELTQLAMGEDKTVDMTGADRRIELVFFKSNRGERASVRVIGKY